MTNSGRWEPVILLVEDDALTSEQLGDLLRNTCRLHFAQNGEQGLTMFEEARPDMVITDILMPGMNGLEMARRIRKLDPMVPIIVITAYSDTDNFGAAGEIFDKMILKPVDIGELLNEIDRCKGKITEERR